MVVMDLGQSMARARNHVMEEQGYVEENVTTLPHYLAVMIVQN